jgi:hypothetical protein
MEQEESLQQLVKWCKPRHIVQKDLAYDEADTMMLQARGLMIPCNQGSNQGIRGIPSDRRKEEEPISSRTNSARKQEVSRSRSGSRTNSNEGVNVVKSLKT